MTCFKQWPIYSKNTLCCSQPTPADTHSTASRVRPSQTQLPWTDICTDMWLQRRWDLSDQVLKVELQGQRVHALARSRCQTALQRRRTRVRCHPYCSKFSRFSTHIHKNIFFNTREDRWAELLSCPTVSPCPCDTTQDITTSWKSQIRLHNAEIRA